MSMIPVAIEDCANAWDGVMLVFEDNAALGTMLIWATCIASRATEASGPELIPWAISIAVILL